MSNIINNLKKKALRWWEKRGREKAKELVKKEMRKLVEKKLANKKRRDENG